MRALGFVASFYVAAATLLAGCGASGKPPPQTLAERGRDIFFNETFDGNGRTCGTCHRAEDNFGLTPNFIATLPADDALFVAETNSALARGFEAPRQMRGNGLIRENLDGFEDLDNKFVLRGVPHVLALRTSVASAAGPRTGWSGDGAPGDGSLRAFAVGAVIQHFPRTLNRVPGADFRLPTDAELDALEAFMLSLGRQQELALPLPLTNPIAARGQALFLDNAVGRCNVCHFNAGANGDPAIFGAGGNLNFNTGVEALPDGPGALLGDPAPPPDDGFGIPGDGTFNTPVLVEAADTGPFFHNNSVATIEAAVGFYDGDAFNQSPAGQLIAQATGSGIELDATQIQAIAAFLRVLNALENIRQAEAYLDQASAAHRPRRAEPLRLAQEEIQDAIDVLAGASLHADAVGDLGEASRQAGPRRPRLERALAALQRARGRLLAPAPPAPTSP
jgi:mono/diheme cytochrome c family protein